MKYAGSTIIIALVLFKLYQIGLVPTPEQSAEQIASTDREQFALDLLHRLNNDTPSPETISFVVEWTIAEDSGDGAMSRNNPLNTTQSSSAATMTVNGDGVKGYATYEDGLNATVETIANDMYNDLLIGLQTNDAQRAFDGLINGPWASSHYNGGADWPNIQLSQPIAQGHKSVVTREMSVNAGFYDTSSSAWVSGMHNGVDYGASHGSPVYMPFDCIYTMVGHYDDAARMGDYLMCNLLDGYEYYSGHLENVQSFGDGQIIPAGTLIGFTNEYDHTHVQLRDTGGNLIDFQEYYETH